MNVFEKLRKQELLKKKICTLELNNHTGEGPLIGKPAHVQKEAGYLLSMPVLAHMRLPWCSSDHSSLPTMSATIVDFLQCRRFDINSLFKTHLRLSSPVLLG